MLLARKNNNYNLWEDFFNDPFFGNPLSTEKSSFMHTDIIDDEDHYTLHIELPGFQKEDIQAELKEGYLTISAQKNDKQDEKDKKGNYIRRERFTGSCRRSFYVGDAVSQEDISASFKDGILCLTVPKEVPKAVEEKAKYIAIE
jgi:HSP20 family molecular chaperone IbpA